MTDKEIIIFEKYRATIHHVQSSIVQKYESFQTVVGNKASDELQSSVLSLSAGIIIEKGMENKPAIEVQAYLYTWFCNISRNLYRKERQKVGKAAQQGELDTIESDDTPPFMESRENLARLSLDIALEDSSNDVRALCEVYLQHGSFDAAIKELGWSKGKVYRTKEAAEALFRKKIVSCGGFFEPRDICEWKDNER